MNLIKTSLPFCHEVIDFHPSYHYVLLELFKNSVLTRSAFVFKGVLQITRLFATWIQITRHGYKLRDMDTNYETFATWIQITNPVYEVLCDPSFALFPLPFF